MNREFGNKKRNKFLDSIPQKSLELVSDNTACRCKFNFSFMDFNQPAGQKFSDWENDLKNYLFERLVEYCKFSLKYWENQRAGSGNNKIFTVYKSFPLKSDFTFPKYIPHEVWWARFWIRGTIRLVGFVLPPIYDQKEQSGYIFDCNTFYVVFLDKDHRFYKVKK
jgi:hypothetical protein